MRKRIRSYSSSSTLERSSWLRSKKITKLSKMLLTRPMIVRQTNSAEKDETSTTGLSSLAQKFLRENVQFLVLKTKKTVLLAK